MSDVLGLYGELGIDLKDMRESPVRCFANSDAHSRNDRRPSASVNTETGAWNCHACGEAGGPYDAALATGLPPAEAMKLLERYQLVEPTPLKLSAAPRISIPVEQVEANHAKLAGNERAMVRLHELRGWTREIIVTYRIGLNGSGLTLPVSDATGELCGLLRYLPNPDTRGDQPKLKADPGSRRELFPTPEQTEGAPLFIVEGEPDALTCLSYDIPAVGIPGANGWKHEWAKRFAGRSVVVCCDCDAQGRALSAKVAEDLLPHAEVRVLDLEPTRTDGYDVGDYLGEGGKDVLLTAAASLEPRQVGGELDTALTEIKAFIRRFIVLKEAHVTLLALWVCHTHAFTAAQTSPYLAINSPEKRCGKSTLLRVLEILVKDPWRVVTPSEAVVYRKIERDKPTLLLDECDAIFGKSADRYEMLRAILNAGNEPDATVPRCEGPKQELRDFHIFCPKALAGIGGLPDTIADRAVSIRLERSLPKDEIERFRKVDAKPVAQRLVEALEDGLVHCEDILRDARPTLPESLDSRAADGWEPLLAIADLAGGLWPASARAAAEELSGDRPDSDVWHLRLLADLRFVFNASGEDRLFTTEILKGLHELEDAGWDDWYGKPLNARKLKEGVAHFVTSVTNNLRPLRRGTERARGLAREDLEEAWARYLPPASPKTGSNA